MKASSNQQLKEHYQQLRRLNCEELWSREVPAFNTASAAERARLVSVVRAVGVVFSETGNPAQKAEARSWLLGLVNDPEEKVRRYAMQALPKLGAAETEESDLLKLLGRAASERESRVLTQTLSRIGGEATLRAGESAPEGLPAVVRQQLSANVARRSNAGRIALQASLRSTEGVRIVLGCRSGLEPFVAEELSADKRLRELFRIETRGFERLELVPVRPFSLSDLFALRCFSELSFLLARLPSLPKAGAPLDLAALAEVIASDATHKIMTAFTEGPVRYRLEFLSRKADAATCQEVAERVFAARPSLVNDSREALWQVQIRESVQGIRVELVPRLRPDPRFAYRTGDVPAASHPPLAAAIVRLAGIDPGASERIWDPFCGSGLELAERVLRGGVAEVFATDLSADALAVTRANVLAAAGSGPKPVLHLAACDFRQAPQRRDLPKLSELTLMLTNPPLGKRVPVADLRSMIGGVFDLAGRLLEVGGRLVLVNPLELRPSNALLKLEFRQKVDLGFAHFHLEKYVRLAGAASQMAQTGQRGERVSKEARTTRGGDSPRAHRPERTGRGERGERGERGRVSAGARAGGHPAKRAERRDGGEKRSAQSGRPQSSRRSSRD